jgi:hypothetical protein
MSRFLSSRAPPENRANQNAMRRPTIQCLQCGHGKTNDGGTGNVFPRQKPGPNPNYLESRGFGQSSQTSCRKVLNMLYGEKPVEELTRMSSREIGKNSARLVNQRAEIRGLEIHDAPRPEPSSNGTQDLKRFRDMLDQVNRSDYREIGQFFRRILNPDPVCLNAVPNRHLHRRAPHVEA